MFDPEKVERTQVTDGSDGYQIGSGYPGEWMVLASDYDQLLELYRQLRQSAPMSYGEWWAKGVSGDPQTP